jgi:hypothetical protein
MLVDELDSTVDGRVRNTMWSWLSVSRVRVPINGRAMVNSSLNWMGGAFWIQACDVLGVTNPVS